MCNAVECPLDNLGRCVAKQFGKATLGSVELGLQFGRPAMYRQPEPQKQIDGNLTYAILEIA